MPREPIQYPMANERPSTVKIGVMMMCEAFTLPFVVLFSTYKITWKNLVCAFGSAILDSHFFSSCAVDETSENVDKRLLKGALYKHISPITLFGSVF
jgi:hypothetical protein